MRLGLVQASTWTKNCQRSLAEIATLSSALFRPRVCPLCQPTMSPANVATSTDKVEKFWVLLGSGGWLQTFPMGNKHFCLARAS